MTRFLDWLTGMSLAARRAITGLLLLSGVLIPALLGEAVPVGMPQTLVGLVGSAALLSGAFGLWYTGLPANLQNATNLKRRWLPGTRRAVAGATFTLWLVALLTYGATLPRSLGGALMVFITIALLQLARLTPEEQTAINETAKVNAESAP